MTVSAQRLVVTKYLYPLTTMCNWYTAKWTKQQNQQLKKKKLTWKSLNSLPTTWQAFWEFSWELFGIIQGRLK